MQYSNTTDKSGIIQSAESLSLLGDGGISNNATLLKQFTSFINRVYFEIYMEILSVDKHWKGDDPNYTDYPEAPITIVAGQRDYTLPVSATGENVATLLRVNRVSVLDGQGKRHVLELMNDDEEFSTESGMPTKYRLNGNSIFFDKLPASGSVTLAGGLIILFQRIPEPFVSTDTTKQPALMASYHDLLPLKASAIYLLPINPTLATQYEQRFNIRLEKLKRDVANMNDDTPRRLTPAYQNNK